MNNLGPFPGILESETERIEITSLTAPDPNWYTIDNQGHYHTFDRDFRLPTLEVKTSVHILDDNSECDCLRVFVCKICQEEVEPGSIPNNIREYTPGPTTYTLNVFEVPLVEAIQWKRVSFRSETVFGMAIRLDVRSSDELSDRTASVSFDVTSLGFRECIPGWEND